MADLIAELADCPFCDGEAWLREETTAPKDCRHYVRCQSCGAETALQPTPEIAAEAWNKRTHHAEIAAAVRKAERYDWLRDTWGGWMAIGGKMQADIRTPSWRGDWPSFDDAIDSAMRAGEGE